MTTPSELSPPKATDWKLVAVTGAALVTVVACFLAVPHHASRPTRR